MMERRTFTEQEIDAMEFPNDELPMLKSEDPDSEWPYWTRCECDCCGAENLAAVSMFGMSEPKGWQVLRKDDGSTSVACEACIVRDESVRAAAVRSQLAAYLYAGVVGGWWMDVPDGTDPLASEAYEIYRIWFDATDDDDAAERLQEVPEPFVRVCLHAAAMLCRFRLRELEPYRAARAAAVAEMMGVRPDDLSTH